MTSQSKSAVGRIVMAALVAVPLLASAEQAAPRDPLAGFRVRVYEYLGAKADVIRQLPPRAAPRTFEAFQTANDRLRMALQRARRHVTRGNLFTAESRPVFRDLLVHAFDDHGLNVRDLRTDMKFDRLAGAGPVAINAPFPPGRRFILVACVTDSLPPLPGDLEYRLDDRDLIILDADVNLVLDVLDRALPGR
jgi:hypothetical protein